jgi:hypothetical protein
MKVNIGPFRDDLIPVTRWEQKYDRWRMKDDFLNTPDEWYDKLVFKFFDKLRDLVAPINRWSNTRPRKIIVEYDKYDTWNLDHTLALIILPGLKQLYTTNHGFFNVDTSDTPEGLNDQARYRWVMEEMIWTFEQILEPRTFTSGTWDMTWKRIDQDGSPNPEGKWREMVKGPNHTFTVDTKAEKAYNDRISNGLRLFGKYYRGLWD